MPDHAAESSPNPLQDFAQAPTLPVQLLGVSSLCLVGTIMAAGYSSFKVSWPDAYGATWTFHVDSLQPVGPSPGWRSLELGHDLPALPQLVCAPGGGPQPIPC